MVVTKKKKNFFSFQHHFHYTVIMRIKYYLAIATTFTTPWSCQEINLFSFQYYLHYTIVIRKILQYCFPEEVKFSVSKRFVHDTVVLMSFFYFFLQEVQCFKKIRTWYTSFIVRNFSGVLHALLIVRNFNGVLHALLPEKKVYCALAYTEKHLQ